MKIKTFQFPLSNYQGNFTSPHFGTILPVENFNEYCHEAFDGKIYTEKRQGKCLLLRWHGNWRKYPLTAKN